MFEKIALAVAAVAALVLVGGLLVTALHSWVRRRTALALETAAEELRLARTAPGEGDATGTASYGGIVDGVPIRIGSAWRLVHAIGTRYVADVSEVRITASLPRPLPFRLEVCRHAVGLPRTLTLFDRQFDRDCAIVTDDPEAARELLSPRELRSDVRSFLRSWVRVSRISRDAVVTTVFNAHTKGAPAVTDAVRRAAALASELSKRGSGEPAETGWKEQVVTERTKRIPNLVTILELNRIRVEGMTNALRGALRKASFRPSGKTIAVSGEPEMIRAAEVLSSGGALFAGDHSGWPPTDVLLELRERGLFPRAFTEVRFRGPGLPVLIRH